MAFTRTGRTVQTYTGRQRDGRTTRNIWSRLWLAHQLVVLGKRRQGYFLSPQTKILNIKMAVEQMALVSALPLAGQLKSVFKAASGDPEGQPALVCNRAYEEL